jgi:hypothetical protein
MAAAQGKQLVTVTDYGSRYSLGWVGGCTAFGEPPGTETEG